MNRVESIDEAGKLEGRQRERAQPQLELIYVFRRFVVFCDRAPQEASQLFPKFLSAHAAYQVPEVVGGLLPAVDPKVQAKFLPTVT